MTGNDEISPQLSQARAVLERDLAGRAGQVTAFVRYVRTVIESDCARAGMNPG
jgi:hypothetical protein